MIWTSQLRNRRAPSVALNIEHDNGGGCAVPEAAIFEDELLKSGKEGIGTFLQPPDLRDTELALEDLKKNLGPHDSGPG